MILRSLILIILLVIIWKYLWAMWTKTSPSPWKWILWLAVFCIAFFLPLYRLLIVNNNMCVWRRWLIPLLLSAWVLYVYFLWPCKNCCDNGSSSLGSIKKPDSIPSGKRDNLKKIEGIWPKIEQLLYEYGITTFTSLASTDPAIVKQILVQWWDNFKNHDPSTWPMQSNMAANGKWEALDTIQDVLKWGKFV